MSPSRTMCRRSLGNANFAPRVGSVADRYGFACLENNRRARWCANPSRAALRQYLSMRGAFVGGCPFGLLSILARTRRDRRIGPQYAIHILYIGALRAIPKNYFQAIRTDRTVLTEIERTAAGSMKDYNEPSESLRASGRGDHHWPGGPARSPALMEPWRIYRVRNVPKRNEARYLKQLGRPLTKCSVSQMRDFVDVRVTHSEIPAAPVK